MASGAYISSGLIVYKAAGRIQDGMSNGLGIIGFDLFSLIPTYWTDMRSGNKLDVNMNPIFLMGNVKFFNIGPFKVE